MTMNCLAKPTQRTARTRSTRASQRSGTLPAFEWNEDIGGHMERTDSVQRELCAWATPVLSVEDARTLLNSIPTDSLRGLRDRALIGVMLFSFARVSAVLGMRVSDFYENGRRRWFRVLEKGGKHHEVPVH